jgi:Tol biopolymer transport system component
VAENVDVWRVPLDARGGIASGPPERLTEDAALDSVLNVDAAGRTLVFRSSRTGRDEVWAKDLQTGGERQLTQSGSSVARIAPDGLTVAVARDVGERHRIELSQLSSGRSSILCEDCLLNGGWSSDGSRLLISRHRGANETAVTLDVESRREVEIAEHPEWSIHQAQFSPDDRWVVFHTTNAPNLRQVYAVPAFLGARVPVDAWVPIAADFGIFPRWSSDGARIYYFSFRDGYMCAWLQQVDPRSKRPIGAPRPVQHFHQPRLRAAVRAPAISDVVDDALYITLTDTTGNIWMLDATRR